MVTVSSPFHVRSPIAQAELAYQQRSSATRRPRHLFRRMLAWPYKVLLAVAVVSSVTLISGEIAAAVIGYDFAALPQAMHTFVGIVLYFIPIAVLIPITLLIHFRTQLRTLAFAANSISREKRGGTWDILLLTPVNAHQIVRGKWWATMHHVWRSYLLLALLRAGALFWVILEANRIRISTYPTYHLEFDARYFTPSALHLLLALLTITGFTMLNAVYTAAFGTLGSVFNRGGGTSLALAIVIRMVTLIALALGIGLGGHFVLIRVVYASPYISYSWDSFPWQLYNMLQIAAVTTFDNGTVLAGVFASYYPPSPGGYAYSDYLFRIGLATGIVTVCLYVWLAWLALRITERVVRRQGALAPRRTGLMVFQELIR